MKNVLVLMHDDAGQEARFQAALDLTRALGGHLTCLDVSILPVVMGDYAVLGGEALLLAGEEAREGDNRTRMEARLTHEDVAFDWIDVTGDLSHSLRDAAVMSDIIVLNRALGSTHYPDMAHVVGDVVTVSDKPVLAVPEEARALDVFGHAVIAWNGSPTSVAALRAALPLLTHASKVDDPRGSTTAASSSRRPTPPNISRATGSSRS
ncbi:MAG: universal stress protein [Sphingomonas sp.]